MSASLIFLLTLSMIASTCAQLTAERAYAPNHVSCQCVRAPCDCEGGSSSSSSSGGSRGSTSNIGGYTVVHTKSGSCPAAVSMLAVLHCRPGCLSDNVCPGTEKCCSYGGCPRCQAAAASHTGSGASTSGSKSGTCPAVRPNQMGSCAISCSSDRSCRGDQKCCSNGCGRSCQTPRTYSPGTVSSPVYKSGTCPVVTSATFGTCISACSTARGDADCSGTQKCCSNGCGTLCMNPVNFGSGSGTVVKPGTCPANLSNMMGACVVTSFNCATDRDCAGSQKCCSNLCGRSCANAVNLSGISSQPGIMFA